MSSAEPDWLSEEQRLRLLVESAQDYAVLLLDNAGRIIRWNSGAERIFGWQEAEVVGQPVSLLFTPEDQAAGVPEQEMAQAGAQGRAPDTRWQVRKDRSRFFADGMLMSLRDEQGVLRGFGKLVRDATEQVRLVQALTESEERFRSLIEATAQIVWVRSPSGEFVTPQPAWSAFTGQDFEQLRGWGWLQALHPEDRDNTAQVWSEAVRNRTLYQVEHRLRRHDGTYRHMGVRGTPLLEPGGSIREWVGMSIDITEQKQAEQEREQTHRALQVSEARFRALVEQAPLSVQILSPEGRTIQVNQAWERLWGVTLEQITGYNMLQDQQLVEKGIMSYIRRGFAGEPTVIPAVFYDPQESIPGLSSDNDARRGGRAFSYPVTEGAGQIGEVVLLHEDISEQKQIAEERAQALAAVQEPEARQSATLEPPLDCIIRIDEESRIVDFNPAAEATFGYRRDEVLDRSMAELIIPPALRQAHYTGLGRYLSTGEGPLLGRRIEVVAMRKDGTEFPVELAITAIALAQGRRLFTAYLRDITERKRAEAALEAAYQRERRIASSLQQSLLQTPREDAFPGILVKTLYAPAWDEAQVGGDFFDVFALEEGKVALLVGDVSGKGLAAAARTSEVKSVLRAFLREHPHPGRALERLNNFLLDAQRLDEDGENAALVTLSLAVVETGTAGGDVVLAVAVAAMEPPLILRHTGEPEAIAVGGPPLGAIPQAEYPVAVVPLAASDLVVLTTDGITEARKDRTDFLGYEGLMSLAREAARSQSSLEETGRAILEGAIAHAGGSLQDDACLLLVRRQ